MKILEGIHQGSAEWAAVRANHFCASEAPIVMAASKYATRTDLLKQKKTGIAPEVDAHKQALFDRGHATEAAARVLVEEMLQEDLFPATAVRGELLASLDGITMTEDVIFEHKLWSEMLAAQVRAGELDPHYFWQLEQQLHVTGAEKVIFVCSDGTLEKFVSMEYRAVPGRAADLLAAWAQFALDLSTFQPAPAADPTPAGRAPETLPALHIEVTGMVTASNLAEFKANALAVFGRINRTLTTDVEFADAERTMKWCGEVESRLAAAKQHALSQTASIDLLFKAIDDISAEARTVRLELDKLVKARKESIRVEIHQEGLKAFTDHVASLNVRLGKPYMPQISNGFLDVIRNKRTVTSLRDAVTTELARLKIAANEVADRIDMNLRMLREIAGQHTFLFADTATIVQKAPDDCRALAENRIAAHTAAEAQKEADTRERIRAEEQAKLQREQDARAEAERQKGLEQQCEMEAAARAEGQISISEAIAAAAAGKLLQQRRMPQDQWRDRQAGDEINAHLYYRLAAAPVQPPAPAPVLSDKAVADQNANAFVDQVEAKGQNVVPMGTRAPAPAGATLSISRINELLSPIALTGDGLERLGFLPVAVLKTSKLYREADLGRICEALTAHLHNVQQRQRAA